MRGASFDPAPLCQPTTAQEVRSALRSPSTRRVLHDTVEGLLRPGSAALRFALQRVKCKPGRKLTVTYDFSVAGGPGRPLTVTWFAPELVEDALGEVDRGLEDEARRRQVAGPFERLSAWLPELGLRIQVSPFDPEFPQLVRLVDPDHIGALLEATLGRCPARPEIGWIRYRPGQRHVLRYGGPGGQGTVFAKLHRGDRRPPVSAEVMTGVLAAGAPPVTAAPMVAAVEADGVELWAHRPGTPLSQLISQGRAVDVALGRTGAALRRLHEAPPRRFGALPQRDLAGEVRVTRRAAAYVGRLSPATGARIDEVLDRADADRATTVPAVVHGDLKADHVLVDGDQLSLVDFDSCALAEPALDVGKFLADLRYWFAASGRPGLEGAQTAFLLGYWGDATVPDRARSYEAVFLARAAARRVPLGDDDWEARTSALADDAGGLLGERVA
jgi:hypothetical protein